MGLMVLLSHTPWPTYNNSVSGVSCGSATSPASSCEDRVCRNSFIYDESACSSSTDINITITATNIHGTGSPSDATVVHSMTIIISNGITMLMTAYLLAYMHRQQKHSF